VEDRRFVIATGFGMTDDEGGGRRREKKRRKIEKKSYIL